MANGARVVALGRSERLLREADAWGKEYGAGRISVHQVRYVRHPGLSQILDRIAAEETTIDVLVNNAHELGPSTGFNVPEGSLEDATLDTWMRNLTGGVYWAALTTQKLGAKDEASAVGKHYQYLHDVCARGARPQLYQGTEFINPPGYSASKAALLSFTRYVASFWGTHGIRANAILPGPFSNTEDWRRQQRQRQSVFEAPRFTCLGRIGRPNELSGALMFLASDASSFMTGQAIIVDGGWTAV